MVWQLVKFKAAAELMKIDHFYQKGGVFELYLEQAQLVFGGENAGSRVERLLENKVVEKNPFLPKIPARSNTI